MEVVYVNIIEKDQGAKNVREVVYVSIIDINILVRNAMAVVFVVMGK